jgi:hypothetical protein
MVYYGVEGLFDPVIEGQNQEEEEVQEVKNDFPPGSICKVNARAVNEKKNNLVGEEKFPDRKEIDDECSKISLENCETGEKTFFITDFDEEFNSASYCKVKLGDKISDKSTDISSNLRNLQMKFDGSNITDVIKDYLPPQSYNTSTNDNMLRTMKVRNMTILDLGESKNEKYLNAVESIILNFLDLPQSDVISFYKSFCDGNINVDLFLGIALLFSTSSFSSPQDPSLIKINTVLSRLLKYFPDILHRIIVGLKDCDGANNKYLIIESIYNQLFKYNTTQVNLNIFSGFKNVMDYLKNLQTVEMVIAIIAIAFVLSKIFDMFRVKVEV